MKPLFKQLPLFSILTSITLVVLSVIAMSPPPSLDLKPVEEKPDLLFQNIELYYYRSGTLTWNLSASHGSLDKEKLVSQLENVSISTIQQNKTQLPFNLHTSKALYNLDTQIITTTKTHSQWTYNTLPIEFFTGPIEWNLTSNTLYSYSEISCNYNNYQLKAKRLFLDLNQQQVELSDNFSIISARDI